MVSVMWFFTAATLGMSSLFQGRLMTVRENPGNWAFTLSEVADRNGFLSTSPTKEMICARVVKHLLPESDLRVQLLPWII